MAVSRQCYCRDRPDSCHKRAPLGTKKESGLFCGPWLLLAQRCLQAEDSRCEKGAKKSFHKLEKVQGATRLGETSLRVLEREICLWVSEGPLNKKTLKNPLKTSENL